MACKSECAINLRVMSSDYVHTALSLQQNTAARYCCCSDGAACAQAQTLLSDQSSIVVCKLCHNTKGSNNIDALTAEASSSGTLFVSQRVLSGWHAHYTCMHVCILL
jgi:hypothetical protein